MKNFISIIVSALAIILLTQGGEVANAQTGSIQGKAFIDINGNGILDVGDVIPSWGMIQLSGPVNASVFPDMSGNYSFSGLPAGTYTAKAKDSAGLTLIVPSTGQYGHYTISLADGETSVDNNFVWFGLGDVYGIVFEDLNSNSARDADEPGVNNRTLRINNTATPSMWSDLYSIALHVRNGTLKQKLVFGIHPLATYGLDGSLGEYDASSDQTCEVARFVEIPSHIGEVGYGIYEDYRPSVSPTQIDTFKIVYIANISQGMDIEISWPNGFNEVLESCQLLNSLESPSINVDMLSVTAATVTTTGTDFLYIVAKRKSSWTGGYRYDITGTNYLYPCTWLPHPDGYFEFRNLLPGTYTLSILTSSGWQAKEVTPGNYEIPVVSSGTRLNYNIAVATVAGPGDTPTFSITFVSNVHDLESYGVNFGIHPSATNGIDPALGEIEYPPFPPVPMLMFTTIDGNAILDLRPYTNSSQIDTYRVGFTPWSDTYPITFSWPDLNPYYSGSVRLKSDLNGSLFDIDMKVQTSYTMVTGPFNPPDAPPGWLQVYLYIIAEGPLPVNALQIVSTYGLTGGKFQAVVHAPSGGPIASSTTMTATEATSVWFEYGPTKSYGTSTTPQAVSGGLNMNISEPFDTGNMPLNTRIHFRAVAQNSGGTFYGGDRVFSKGNPPPEPPEDTSKYRTFNQIDLSQQKDSKSGKVGNRFLYFTFHNTLDDTIYGLHIRFSIKPEVFSITHNMHEQIPWYDSLNVMTLDEPVLPNDSVVFYILIYNNKIKRTTVKYWWWLDGIPDINWRDQTFNRLGQMQPGMNPTGILDTYIQPNAGNVRDYLYKKVITRPNGLVIGIPQPNRDSAKLHGWIRFKNADKKYFPHSGPVRCFDLIATGNGGTKQFVKELPNPHVNKHNNLLLGDLHALKLAIIANDYGVTEPDIPATRLGDLIYNDPVNSGDPLNTLTLRQIAYLADSGLTYCANFSPTFYAHTDEVISRVVQAFDGTYRAVSFAPLKIAGTYPLPSFLHPNPTAVPFVLPLPQYSLIDNQPESFSLSQNYPNPFNPSTTISFELSEDAFVTLKIYNILGQEIAALAEKEEFGTGLNELQFDGSGLSSGVYYYRIVAEDINGKGILYSNVKKMLMIK